MMMVIANNPELFIYRFIYYSFNFSALKYCVRIFNQQKKITAAQGYSRYGYLTRSVNRY